MSITELQGPLFAWYNGVQDTDSRSLAQKVQELLKKESIDQVISGLYHMSQELSSHVRWPQMCAPDRIIFYAVVLLAKEKPPLAMQAAAKLNIILFKIRSFANIGKVLQDSEVQRNKAFDEAMKVCLADENDQTRLDDQLRGIIELVATGWLDEGRNQALLKVAKHKMQSLDQKRREQMQCWIDSRYNPGPGEYPPMECDEMPLK